MRSLRTKIFNYRYTNAGYHYTSPTFVTWFVLKNINGEEEGRCFTQAELDQFLAYIQKTPDNFLPNFKDRFPCRHDEAPVCLKAPQVGRVKNFILRRDPTTLAHGVTNTCMEIILTNPSSNTDSHHYDLPFDIVGKV